MKTNACVVVHLP